MALKPLKDRVAAGDGFNWNAVLHQSTLELVGSNTYPELCYGENQLAGGGGERRKPFISRKGGKKERSWVQAQKLQR